MCTLCDSTNIKAHLTYIVYDNLLKPRKTFRITLQNHKECTYRAPVRYVTNTWSVVILNKKTYTSISSVLCVTSC